jgi:capsular exopolysaccharide synthesis family protein
LFIFLKDLLHYKIESRLDVERITKLPILGEIPISEVGNIAVAENQNRETDEAFRMLRTNMLFQLGKDKKVIIVTSTEPKEGKTFISINTAISFALLGKKVLLMGLDLRLPRMTDYLNVKADRGMSQYLSGYITDLSSLIQPSGITPNLSVIASGVVPPNPTELISKDIFEEAIKELRGQFDYIIIDSAPVGLVTDTIVASKAVDATMYVCRANVSHRNNLKFANELLEKKMLPNMGLVVNDISNYFVGYGGYGKRTYSYGYGYGYGRGKKKKQTTKLGGILNGFRGKK